MAEKRVVCQLGILEDDGGRRTLSCLMGHERDRPSCLLSLMSRHAGPVNLEHENKLYRAPGRPKILNTDLRELSRSLSTGNVNRYLARSVSGKWDWFRSLIATHLQRRLAPRLLPSAYFDNLSSWRIPRPNLKNGA